MAAAIPAARVQGVERRRWWLLSALMLALGLAIYHPVRQFDFVNFDDDAFISQNPWLAMGLTWKSLRWAVLANLTEYSSTAEYWSPITLLSRLLDAQFYGIQPGPFHITSAALHVVNALLLAAAGWRLTGKWGRSAMVALLFLVHPQNVEPVCWLSARKDLLSATFVFVTLLAYAHYVRQQTRARYALLLLAYGACLMAKPMGVSLPLALWILDFWPLRRWVSWKTGREENLRLIAEKIPLLIMAGLGGALAVVSQQDWQALHTEGYPLSVRAANAAIGYVMYVRRLFWPSDLAIYYPHPGPQISFGWAAVCALLLAVLTLGVWMLRRRAPYVLAGWLWFGLVLGPVIGLVQIGGQAMADRYAYPAVIGLFFALVWGAAEWVPRRVAVAIVIVGVAVFAMAAYRQVLTWRNSVTVFTQALAVTQNNSAAHLNLGCALMDRNELPAAREEFLRALAIKPFSALAWNNLARTETLLGNEEAAIRTYQSVLRIDPDQKQSLLFLGRLLRKHERLEEAQPLFEHLHGLAPNLPQPLFELGEIHAARGRVQEARAAWEQYLQMRPEDETAKKRLAELPGK